MIAFLHLGNMPTYYTSYVVCKGDGLLIVDFKLSKTGAFKVIFCLLSRVYCNQENFKLKYKLLHNSQEQVMGELEPKKSKFTK